MPHSPPDRPAARPFFGFGRLLPRAVRERVFEPAYYDVLSAHVARHAAAGRFTARWRLGVRVLGSAVDALRVGAFERLRTVPARKLRLAVVIAVLVILLAGMMFLGDGGYAGPYDPTGP